MYKVRKDVKRHNGQRQREYLVLHLIGYKSIKIKIKISAKLVVSQCVQRIKKILAHLHFF